jgi:hypothetical protein
MMTNLVHKPLYWKTHYSHLKAIETEVFKRSGKGGIDVTVVRPGELVDQDLAAPRPGVVAEEGFGIKDVGPGTLSRESLSAFIVDQVLQSDSKWASKGVAVGQV